jgi:hypothetical protein
MVHITEMSNRMYLRVKRRRSSAILPTIRLEGLGDSRKRNRNLEDEISDLRISSATNDAPDGVDSVDPQPQSRRRRAAVWKRIELNDTDDKKRSVHLVEALLEDDLEADSKQSAKRRRLTLLDTDADSQDVLFKTVSKKKTKAGFKILTPLQRLVDDSLQMVHSGEVSIDQHVRFIKTDPNLATQSRQWLAWCHSSSGNLLHACATWNNVEVASELLALDLDGLGAAQDQQGLTPYEVADLSGHTQICEVLEAFGADSSNYVFDIYCLDDADENNEESESKGNEQTSLELQGGVGYWNEEGQLILEMPTTAGESGDNDEDNDDDDSNDEGWGGNDYPDEDAGAWVDNDEEEDRPDDTFRMRPAKHEDAAEWDDDDGDEEEDRPDNTFRMRPAKRYEEDDDVAFDASYGIISAQTEPEYDTEI